MEVTNIIILVASLITAVGVIIGAIKKIIDKVMQPINKKIDCMDERQCKNALIDFMNDLECGQVKDEVQTAYIHEVYDHYTNDLHCNSYIHDRWERVIDNKYK